MFASIIDLLYSPPCGGGCQRTKFAEGARVGLQLAVEEKEKPFGKLEIFQEQIRVL